MKSSLGYILTDKSGKFAWHGPGFKPITGEIPARLPIWSDRKEALLAAKGLKEGMGIDAKPVAIGVKTA